MLKALRMDSDTCTGCHQCEMMCSYGKVGAFNPAKSVMDVSLYNGGAVEAITINPTTGAKEISAEVCVGCKVCSIACPYGAINYDADSGVVTKCDLCGGEPMCVEACPTPALAFVDKDSTGYDRIWNHVTAELVDCDSTVRH